MAPRIHILHTVRVRRWCVATIPMPEPKYDLETTVRIGALGPTYTVLSDESGGDISIYPQYLPRRRPMRRCGLRDAICAVVARALPATRPLGSGAS